MSEVPASPAALDWAAIVSTARVTSPEVAWKPNCSTCLNVCKGPGAVKPIRSTGSLPTPCQPCARPTRPDPSCSSGHHPPLAGRQHGKRHRDCPTFWPPGSHGSGPDWTARATYPGCERRGGKRPFHWAIFPAGTAGLSSSTSVQAPGITTARTANPSFPFGRQHVSDGVAPILKSNSAGFEPGHGNGQGAGAQT